MTKSLAETALCRESHFNAGLEGAYFNIYIYGGQVVLGSGSYLHPWHAWHPLRAGGTGGLTLLTDSDRHILISTHPRGYTHKHTLSLSFYFTHMHTHTLILFYTCTHREREKERER